MAAILLAFLPAASPAALVSNGDFASSLDSWSTTGAVFDSSGIAVLTDGSTTRSLLYQPVAVASGAFTLSFDFRNALSSSVPEGAVADSFFATIYFADSLAGLDIPNGVFADSAALFDMDSSGNFNVNGTISASSKGSDWWHFTLTFNTTHSIIAPAFDLRELNTTDNDSAVAIDNVVLNTAPTVTSGPMSQGVSEGSDVMFSVAITTERAVTYQWRHDGADISGATSDSLSLTDVRLPDAGVYTVAISDQFGTSVSAPAFLAVLRIASVEKGAAGATIGFPTVANVTYTLEANEVLAATGWGAVGADIVGTGTAASIEDGAALGAKRFYRLRAFGGTGTPSGYLQITIPRGKSWPAATPFLSLADDAGSVSTVDAGTITDASALWTDAQWTQSPHLVRFTTGSAAGRVFAITANTATQLSLDAPGEDLGTLVSVGDRYEIAPLATLGSLFGIVPTVVQGSTSPVKADLVKIWNGLRYDSFFNDGTGWKSAKAPLRGQPRADANGTLLFPDEGFTITRRGKTPLVFTFSGLVPTGTQRVSIAAKGTAFVAQRFPAALPLGESNFELLPGWSKRDAVKVWDATKLRFFTYAHDGTEWHIGRKGANAVPIPPATACFVVRRTKTGAAGVVAHEPPFTLSP